MNNTINTNHEYMYEQLNVLNNVFNRTIKNESLQSPIPNTITTPLLEHQRAMVQYMHFYFMNMLQGVSELNETLYCKIGLIGDPPGTGKTLTILSFIASLPFWSHSIVTNELNINSNQYFYSKKYIGGIDCSSSNIIIVPRQLLEHWKGEIKKHTTLDFTVIESKRAFRLEEQLVNKIKKSKLVLVSSSTYKHLNDFAKKYGITWNHMFIDEASRIYFSSSDPPLNFQFLWFITSNWVSFLFKNTYILVKNLLHISNRLLLNEECSEWLLERTNNNLPLLETVNVSSSSFFKNIIPYFHPLKSNYVILSSNELLKRSIPLPKINIAELQCKALMNPNIIASLLIANPKRLEDTYQLPIYLHGLNIKSISAVDYLETFEERKRKNIESRLEDICPICFEEPNYLLNTECCNHSFCATCIIKHMMNKNACPTCRSYLDLHNISWISKTDGNGNQTHETNINEILKSRNEPYKTRQEVLMEILDANPEGKYIIYTSFPNVSYELQHMLYIKYRNERKVELLDKNNHIIYNEVLGFQEGNTNCVFITNYEEIRGLSLSAATHLIFFHDPPSVDAYQLLVSSCQRVGRPASSPLEITHLRVKPLL